MRRGVHGIDPHLGARGMGQAGDVRDRVDGAHGVGGQAHGHEARACSEDALELLEVEACSPRPGCPPSARQATLLRDAQPGSHVGVVVEARDDDLVPVRERRADGPAEREGDGRHVGPEADLVSVAGAEEVGRGVTDVMDELVGLEAGCEGAAVVGVAGQEVVVDGPQAGVHDLRAGGTVEPGHRLPVGTGSAERGEAGADGVDVPVGHVAESSLRPDARRPERVSCAVVRPAQSWQEAVAGGRNA